MMVVKTGKAKLPELKVQIGNQKEVKGQQVKDGHLEYIVPGDERVKIAW